MGRFAGGEAVEILLIPILNVFLGVEVPDFASFLLYQKALIYN